MQHLIRGSWCSALSAYTNPRSDIQSSAGDNAAGTRKGCAYNLRHENADWYEELARTNLRHVLRQPRQISLVPHRFC